MVLLARFDGQQVNVMVRIVVMKMTKIMNQEGFEVVESETKQKQCWK